VRLVIITLLTVSTALAILCITRIRWTHEYGWDGAEIETVTKWWLIGMAVFLYAWVMIFPLEIFQSVKQWKSRPKPKGFQVILLHAKPLTEDKVVSAIAQPPVSKAALPVPDDRPTQP
jgi:hypothetical protein